MAAAVENDTATQAAIRAADLVTYQAGINDFITARAQVIAGTCGGSDNQACLRAMVTAFGANWDRLAGDLRSYARQGVAYRTMDVYYPTPAYDASIGIFAVLNPYLQQMNQYIASHSPGPMARVHGAFDGPDGTQDPYVKGYLLPDDVHPNWLGHEVIFWQLRALGYSGVSAVIPSVGGIAEQPDVSVRTNPDMRFAGHFPRYAVDGSVALAILLVAGATPYLRRQGKR